MKEAFLTGLSPQVRSNVRRQLHDKALIRRSKDGSVVLLPELEVLATEAEREVELTELDSEAIQSS